MTFFYFRKLPLDLRLQVSSSGIRFRNDPTLSDQILSDTYGWKLIIFSCAFLMPICSSALLLPLLAEKMNPWKTPSGPQLFTKFSYDAVKVPILHRTFVISASKQNKTTDNKTKLFTRLQPNTVIYRFKTWQRLIGQKLAAPQHRLSDQEINLYHDIKINELLLVLRRPFF